MNSDAEKDIKKEEKDSNVDSVVKEDNQDTKVDSIVKEESNISMQEQLNEYYTSVTGLKAEEDSMEVSPEVIKKKRTILIIVIIILAGITGLCFFVESKTHLIRNLVEDTPTEEVDDSAKIDNTDNIGIDSNEPVFNIEAPTLPEIVEDSCTETLVDGTKWSYCLDSYGNAINVHSLTSLTGDVSVPSVLDSHQVTAVGLRESNRLMSLCKADVNCKNITSVTIPSGVKYIEKYLFYHLESLTTVTLPDTVEYIGDYAFAYCTSLIKLNSNTNGMVYMPRSLRYYGSYLFSYDSYIDDFDFPSQIDYINSYTFYHCNGFKDVTINGQFKVVFPGAFANDGSLRSVTFEDGVVLISGFSSNSNLSKVVIADSVKAIAQKAFAGDIAISTFEYSGKLAYLGKNIFGNAGIDINDYLTTDNIDKSGSKIEYYSTSTALSTITNSNQDTESSDDNDDGTDSTDNTDNTEQ